MAEQVDHSRRRLLTAATVGTGVIGVAFAAVPFLASWKPSARAKRLALRSRWMPSKLEAGQMLKVVWRGQAVFVVRRVKAVVDQLGGHDDDAGRSEVRRFDSARLHQGRGRGSSAQSRILGGTGGVHPSGLLASGRVRARIIPSRSRAPIWARIGRGILLPLPRLEV